jgi:hypothetical protein
MGPMLPQIQVLLLKLDFLVRRSCGVDCGIPPAPIGSAIYVFGSVDQGMNYSWSLGSGTTPGTPRGDLLIHAEGFSLTTYRSDFTLTISLSQYVSGARFQFSRADIVVGTGMSEYDRHSFQDYRADQLKGHKLLLTHINLETFHFR